MKRYIIKAASRSSLPKATISDVMEETIKNTAEEVVDNYSYEYESGEWEYTLNDIVKVGVEHLFWAIADGIRYDSWEDNEIATQEDIDQFQEDDRAFMRACRPKLRAQIKSMLS